MYLLLRLDCSYPTSPSNRLFFKAVEKDQTKDRYKAVLQGFVHYLISSIDHEYQDELLSEKARQYVETWSHGNDDEIDEALHTLLFACVSQQISDVQSLFELSVYQFLVISAVKEDLSIQPKDYISSRNATLMYIIRGIILLDILLEFR
jgi:hypothetical protein